MPSERSTKIVDQGELHGLYIQNVDTTKPFGRIIENYANKKWWNGFYIGCSSSLSLVILYHLIERYMIKK